MSKRTSKATRETCGDCRHFIRSVWNGTELTTGVCLRAKEGTVSFRRQSSTACLKKEKV